MEIDDELLIMPFFLGVVPSYALEYVHLRMLGALTVLAHARSPASRWVPRAVRVTQDHLRSIIHGGFRLVSTCGEIQDGSR